MNDTTTTKTLEEDDLEITVFNIVLCILSFAMMIFVCTGNILTLLAIATTPILRSQQSTIYVFSLAIADLIVGLGFSMTGVFMLPPWKRDYFDHNMNVCVFMQGSIIGTAVVSSLHMTLISFDRYVYITRPYVYPRIFTKSNILLFLTAIWMFGIATILTPQFVYIDDSASQSDCDLSRTLPVWYLFFLTTVAFFINIVTACVFYSQILLVAIKQRNAIHATSVAVGKLDSSNDEMDTSKSRSSDKSSSSSRKLGWKSIKFFFTIFGFYFVCVTPCVIALSIDVFGSINEDLVRATTLVLMLNSGMNFIIYAVINKQFQRAFSDILHCRAPSQ